MPVAPSGAIARVSGPAPTARAACGRRRRASSTASSAGAIGLSIPLTDPEIGRLNPLAVNALRSTPGAGITLWGARTRERQRPPRRPVEVHPGAAARAFLEESLYRGTQWVVFEPNDAPLWAQIRLNVGAFMNTLFRQGAFAGTTPREAFFVKCDAETTTPDDINNGIVNIIVGFAPLKPAEFVVITLQQIAGQTGGA